MNTSPADVVYYFRWVWNLLFWGIPWIFTSIAIVGINIGLNIAVNGVWADGNFFLILDTLFLISQTVLSWPMALQLPEWLDRRNWPFRIIRGFSLSLAIFYVLFEIVVFSDWIYGLFIDPKEDVTLIDMFINMFMAYNMIFNLPMLPANLMIIFDEIWFKILPPMLDQNKRAALADDNN